MIDAGGRHCSFKSDIDVDIRNLSISRTYVSTGQNGETCASSVTDMKRACRAHEFQAVSRDLGVLEGVLAPLDIFGFDLTTAKHMGKIPVRDRDPGHGHLFFAVMVAGHAARQECLS